MHALQHLAPAAPFVHVGQEQVKVLHKLAKIVTSIYAPNAPEANHRHNTAPAIDKDLQGW